MCIYYVDLFVNPFSNAFSSVLWYISIMITSLRYRRFGRHFSESFLLVLVISPLQFLIGELVQLLY